MKCKLCKTEMILDRAVERQEDGITEFHYKCPNKNCSNYGYKTAERAESKTE